jgi:hypothetical protein
MRYLLYTGLGKQWLDSNALKCQTTPTTVLALPKDSVYVCLTKHSGKYRVSVIEFDAALKYTCNTYTTSAKLWYILRRSELETFNTIEDEPKLSVVINTKAAQKIDPRGLKVRAGKYKPMQESLRHHLKPSGGHIVEWLAKYATPIPTPTISDGRYAIAVIYSSNRRAPTARVCVTTADVRDTRTTFLRHKKHWFTAPCADVIKVTPTLKEKAMSDKTNPKHNNPVPSFIKLTMPQRIKIYERLKTAGVVNEDGAFVYNEGLNDTTLGTEVIPEYPGSRANGVASVRKELFGPLPVRKVAPVAGKKAAIERLETIVAYLCKQLGVDPDNLPSQKTAVEDEVAIFRRDVA